MPIPSMNVALIGVGQLGSRYLQGLSKCENRLQIFIHDVDIGRLMLAKQVWIEFGGLTSIHNILFSKDINELPKDIHLAIIATTANVRPQIISRITYKSYVKYWLIEKVLAQDNDGLNLIMKSIGSNSKAWVNTPRRALTWHNKIKEQIPVNAPLSMTVSGNSWGLACNAIHFLDLMAWWSGEKLIKISTDLLDNVWFEAKRPGNFEINGIMGAEFSKGSKVVLSSSNNGGDTDYVIRLSYGDTSWKIDEANGFASCSNGVSVPGYLPYQSEMTPLLVDEILTTHNCQLTPIDESVEMTRVLIQALLQHWQKHVDLSAKSILIT